MSGETVLCHVFIEVERHDGEAVVCCVKRLARCPVVGDRLIVFDEDDCDARVVKVTLLDGGGCWVYLEDVTADLEITEEEDFYGTEVPQGLAGALKMYCEDTDYRWELNDDGKMMLWIRSWCSAEWEWVKERYPLGYNLRSLYGEVFDDLTGKFVSVQRKE